LKQYGVVTTVADGVITISGLPSARMGEVLLIKEPKAANIKLVENKNTISSVIKPARISRSPVNAPVLAVILNLEYTQIRALLLDQFSDVREKYLVYRLYRRLSTIVGDLDI
jgi:F0F1-type ATP synthase alpha subunit